MATAQSCGAPGPRATPASRYQGSVTLTRKGTTMDSGNVIHTLDETLALTNVWLDKVTDGVFLSPQGVVMNTRVAIDDSHVDGTSETDFQLASTSLTQFETVVNLVITDALAPLSGPIAAATYQLAVTGYTAPEVKATVVDSDGTNVSYEDYPVAGQATQDITVPSNWDTIAGTETQDVDGIPWAITWSFAAN